MLYLANSNSNNSRTQNDSLYGIHIFAFISIVFQILKGRCCRSLSDVRSSNQFQIWATNELEFTQSEPNYDTNCINWRERLAQRNHIWLCSAYSVRYGTNNLHNILKAHLTEYLINGRTVYYVMVCATYCAFSFFCCFFFIRISEQIHRNHFASDGDSIYDGNFF